MMGNTRTLAALKARHQTSNESPAPTTALKPVPVPDRVPLVFHPPAGTPTRDVAEEYGAAKPVAPPARPVRPQAPYVDRRKANKSGGRPTDQNAAPATVLAAARGLEQPFGKTALVLAAWRRDPKRFGLAGCEEMHPDCNKVLVYLYGRRGLIARGKVVPDGDLYRVAEDKAHE